MSPQSKPGFMASFAKSPWVPPLFIVIGSLFFIAGVSVMVSADNQDSHVLAISLLVIGAWDVVVGVMGLVLRARKRKARLDNPHGAFSPDPDRR